MKLLTWIAAQVLGRTAAPPPDRAPVGSPRRSSRWPACRAAHLAAYPTCAACGRKDHLQVHHVRPFHVFPELELSPGNLLTLCEAPGRVCHLKVGHNGNWHDWNPAVVADAAKALAKAGGKS